MTAKAANLNVDKLRFWRQKAWSGLGGVNPDQTVTLAGYDLFSELVGKISLASCIHLYLKKSLPSPQVERLLSAIVTATVYPDIRIWPNRAVAFCATGNTGNAAGIASGMLGMEGLMFGGDCVSHSFKFLADLRESEKQGNSIEEEIEKLDFSVTRIPGFGRPLVKGDERLKPILQVARECGLDNGEWLKLGRRVEKLLAPKNKIMLNAAGLMACLLGDMKFSCSEIRAFGAFAPVISLFGVFNEHSRPDAKPVFPLAIEDIEYVGQEPVCGEKESLKI